MGNKELDLMKLNGYRARLAAGWVLTSIIVTLDIIISPHELLLHTILVGQMSLVELGGSYRADGN